MKNEYIVLQNLPFDVQMGLSTSSFHIQACSWIFLLRIKIHCVMVNVVLIVQCYLMGSVVEISLNSLSVLDLTETLQCLSFWALMVWQKCIWISIRTGYSDCFECFFFLFLYYWWTPIDFNFNFFCFFNSLRIYF